MIGTPAFRTALCKTAYTGLTLKTKLVRLGDDVALMLDPAVLEEVGLDETSEEGLTIEGESLIIARVALGEG